MSFERIQLLTLCQVTYMQYILLCYCTRHCPFYLFTSDLVLECQCLRCPKSPSKYIQLHAYALSCANPHRSERFHRTGQRRRLDKRTSPTNATPQQAVTVEMWRYLCHSSACSQGTMKRFTRRAREHLLQLLLLSDINQEQEMQFACTLM